MKNDIADILFKYTTGEATTAKSAVQSSHCTALFLIHKNEKANIISARRSRTVR